MPPGFYIGKGVFFLQTATVYIMLPACAIQIYHFLISRSVIVLRKAKLLHNALVR